MKVIKLGQSRKPEPENFWILKKFLTLYISVKPEVKNRNQNYIPCRAPPLRCYMCNLKGKKIKIVATLWAICWEIYWLKNRKYDLDLKIFLPWILDSCKLWRHAIFETFAFIGCRDMCNFVQKLFDIIPRSFEGQIQIQGHIWNLLTE